MLGSVRIRSGLGQDETPERRASATSPDRLAAAASPGPGTGRASRRRLLLRRRQRSLRIRQPVVRVDDERIGVVEQRAERAAVDRERATQQVERPVDQVVAAVNALALLHRYRLHRSLPPRRQQKRAGLPLSCLAINNRPATCRATRRVQTRLRAARPAFGPFFPDA
ncbi:hypothetical protein GNZ24_18920 [Burkholderia thailandensis]|nr:hypothetical protein A8H31_23555 [Burkholderia thailandensis]AWY60526.1 hypothetical protein A8H35_18990 [Burkholderia thailandensis]AWY69601.1 hypothetical protein A8H36_28620 [Burkholderia thailandensis]MUV21605.1 hypothetical protein [Burkholderia thailandensis]MUV29046.1 hypothetical protein [Burkholderia thailandensis]